MLFKRSFQSSNLHIRQSNHCQAKSTVSGNLGIYRIRQSGDLPYQAIWGYLPYQAIYHIRQSRNLPYQESTISGNLPYQAIWESTISGNLPYQAIWESTISGNLGVYHIRQSGGIPTVSGNLGIYHIRQSGDLPYQAI